MPLCTCWMSGHDDVLVNCDMHRHLIEVAEPEPSETLSPPDDNDHPPEPPC